MKPPTLYLVILTSVCFFGCDSAEKLSDLETSGEIPIVLQKEMEDNQDERDLYAIQQQINLENIKTPDDL